jgi:hypothetical protein
MPVDLTACAKDADEQIGQIHDDLARSKAEK